MDIGNSLEAACQRLTHFSGAIPIDAVLALSLAGGDPLDEAALARLLSTGALAPDGGGFRVDPTLEQLARAMTCEAAERAADLAAFGRWLSEHISEIEASARDNAAAFDRLQPFVPDVHAAVGRLASSGEPALAAELWCAISDLLFYRRLLAFDCPEYEVAIRCADEARNVELSVRTRIVAGRAIIEVKSPSHARGYFEGARELAEAHHLDDWTADAVRGLGWVLLAEGDLAGAKEHFSRAHTVHQATEHMRGIADASMALGTLNVLSANPQEAKRLFFRAEAILRARHDTVRLAKLEGLRQTLGLAEGGLARGEDAAQSGAAQARDLHTLLARGQYWRAALLLLRSDEADDTGRARVLADLAGVSWKELLASSRGPSRLIPKSADMDKDRWWELRGEGNRRVLVAPDGRKHDLTRRGPFVRLLSALASSRGPLSASSLFEAAWPERGVRHESALLRVYTTVRRLRNLGVPIATSGDGYFCDRIRTAP